LNNARTILPLIGREWFLLIPTTTSLAFLGGLRAETNGTVLALTLGLFVVLLGCSLNVVRHAEHLAARLGEPYGTLLLTFAVTIIEVMSISALMTHDGSETPLARDTVFAVVMILLNFMVGVSLLAGGWKYREQQFNLQGANAYLGVIIPLTVLSLILPSFTNTTSGPTLSGAQELFVASVSVGLYATFLGMQTVRHRGYFMLGETAVEERHPQSPLPTWLHTALLAAYLGPLVYLAEQLGEPMDKLLSLGNIPHALGGTLIALLVAAPEALGAVRAALANQLQRAMNIFMGSVLSTIGLTIPAMILLSRIRGNELALGLNDANAMLLALTLVVSLITFSSRRTNVLQGAVHLVLFGAYLLLIFQS
jgi:Ca2+:H+ antiporter